MGCEVRYATRKEPRSRIEQDENNTEHVTVTDQACPPMTLPQLVISGPRILPPSPLNQPTISCGESVHLTLANRGLTVVFEHGVKRETRKRWSNDYSCQLLAQENCDGFRKQGRTVRRRSMGHRVLPMPTSFVRENRRYSSSTWAKLNSSRPA